MAMCVEGQVLHGSPPCQESRLEQKMAGDFDKHAGEDEHDGGKDHSALLEAERHGQDAHAWKENLEIRPQRIETHQ